MKVLQNKEIVQNKEVPIDRRKMSHQNEGKGKCKDFTCAVDLDSKIELKGGGLQDACL